MTCCFWSGEIPPFPDLSTRLSPSFACNRRNDRDICTALRYIDHEFRHHATTLPLLCDEVEAASGPPLDGVNAVPGVQRSYFVLRTSPNGERPITTREPFVWRVIRHLES